MSAIIVKIMTRIGVMDTPVSRSSHTIPTPKGGGVGIVCAFLIGSIIIFPLLHQPYLFSVLALLITVAFLSIISWLDDLKQWPALIKLVAQIVCAIVIVICTVPISVLQNSSYILVPIILIWLVYVTNALNFMDGLNGLTSGVTAICCLFFYIYTQQFDYRLISLALFCGLLGFLPFNYPKAEIFMGDVGSQACGFLLAYFAISPLSQKSHFDFNIIPTETFLIFFVLFAMIYDVTFTLIRRIKEKDPLLKAHRSHLYQMAHRCTIKASVITLIHWAFSIWGGIIFVYFPPTSSFPIFLDLGLLLCPQLVWTLYIYYQTVKYGIKKW
ncbi:glycosyltransferase family 4 protein [Commensalibacter oyaizuii]|uniref:Glycosyltransferase family 4 protein n=1 Tax=Commensalibacter oyaizuii TaxID=3043873 RepID=A0ABT6Q0N0_9PROT|nr:glycosyltransferase family 4 protein [Commensalibacter sp. TBRC 16381]MDI2090044.1 glycosyltransferase family 4 protein [Commensalibacter sp. TBRC 16381]